MNKRVFCSEYSKLNDPFEGIFNSYQPRPLYNTEAYPKQTKTSSVNELWGNKKQNRICSLSSKLNDVKLWSLYAGGHEGVAIEIQFKESCKDLHEVKYTKELPQVYNTPLNSPTSIDILTKKTLHWKYESEYRLIVDSPYYDLKECAIKRLILGTRITADRVELLKQIIPKSISIDFAKLDSKNVEIIT